MSRWTSRIPDSFYQILPMSPPGTKSVWDQISKSINWPPEHHLTFPWPLKTKYSPFWSLWTWQELTEVGTMTLSLTKSLQTVQKTCSVCGCLISSVYYTLDSGEVVCERDYLKTLDQCRKCGQPVQGKLVKLSGSSYHPECFSCQVIIIFTFIFKKTIRGLNFIRPARSA